MQGLPIDSKGWHASTWLFKLFVFWFGITSCVFNALASDRQSEWQIVPSTCINNKPGDLCRVEITVNVPGSLIKSSNSNPQEICFYIEQQLLHCLSSQDVNPNGSQVKIPVEITQSSILEIRVNQNTVAQKHLTVQSLAPNNKRRRVRNPWSFF